MMNFIKDDQNHWTVVLNNKSHQFDKSHPNYETLVDAVRNNKPEEFLAMMEVGKNIHNWSEGNFAFVDGVLYYGQEEIHSVITDRIVDLIKEKFPYQHMLRFLENLYRNPSYSSITQLYNFMVHKHLPITPDGYILMYKAIQNNWTDKWTGKINNAVGATPSMPRHQVVDDPNWACGPGLHAGSIEYVKGYGSGDDRTIIVKVDPANVVSVPRDSSCQKVRTCGYTVVAEYDGDLIGASVSRFSQENSENDENDLDNDEKDDTMDDEDRFDDDEDPENA